MSSEKATTAGSSEKDEKDSIEQSTQQHGLTFAEQPKTATGDRRLSIMREATARSSRDLDMRRELTIEERRELAEAGDEKAITAQQRFGAFARGFFRKQKAPEASAKDAQVDMDEHLLSFEALQKKLETSFDGTTPAKSRGLTSSEAAARLQRNGANVLNPPPGQTAFQRFFHCLTQLFNLLLIICAILEWAVLGIDYSDNIPNIWIAAILFCVAFLNAGIEFIQAQAAENTLKASSGQELD